LEFSEVEESPPFKQRGFQTPVWPFRPRKFSSPFVSVPRLHFDDASDSLIQPREDTSSALFDSGIGSTFADYEAEKGRLCPRYHNDGICDLGRNCPLTHEEKRPTERILTSSFDPNAPEFVPRPRRPPPPTWSTDDDNIMKSDAGTDDELARDLTKLALHMKKNFTPRGLHSNEIKETDQQNRFRSKGVKDLKSPRHSKDIK
uniref:C3H1-type domain-containing protein n=1 Tax=Ciona savignyi TaxID=51511 RepID=H2ZCW5_CIOSA